MSYSICLIDDQIPVKRINGYDDSALISSSMLNHMIEEEIEWDELPLKVLVEQLLEKEEFTLVKAFTNPNFYFQYRDQSSYTPEILIFDWDYPDSEDREAQLLKLLEESFTLVFIFTGFDETDQVKDLLEKSKFSDTKNRVTIFEKGVDAAVEKLLTSVSDKMKDNFSFSFGKELRLNSSESVENILVELGKVSVNQIGYYLQIGDESRQDFIEFIGERFKNHLIVSEKIKELELDDNPDQEEVENLAPKIWSHRLYHFEKRDKRVRKGDVVTRDSNYYLIITADCDLNDHMKKNFGYVTYVPLHDVSEKNNYLINQISNSRTKEYFEKQVKRQSTYFWVTSLTNSIQGLSGTILIPFLEKDGEIQNFVLFPKELRSELYKLKEGNQVKYLKYDESFPFQKITSISEPFKTPLIQHILYTLGGYGVPDYPKNVQMELATKLGDLFS